MAGLASLIEEAIRYPGFAFVNVQSPCVTYGSPEAQLKQQKATMQDLKALGHDPADKLRAYALAEEYGSKLYVGVFYRRPIHEPTMEGLAAERHAALREQALPKNQILKLFAPA
jgi:2-oxoglutarate ferredoxin oxidoreductase subunit beta